MIDLVHQAWDALWAIPHIRLYLSLGWIAYLVGLGVWIVLQKREPVATLSWLLGLAALPYVGLVVYQLIGPLRIRRHRLRRARARVQAGEVPTLDDPDARELARLGKATTGLPPSTARRADLLAN